MKAVKKAQVQIDIERLIRSFDFLKVKKAMEALNWKWASPDKLEVPSIEKMKETVRSLAEHVNRASWRSGLAQTGGFTVWREGKYYGLRFCIDDVDSELME